MSGQKIMPCRWFDGEAEEAVAHYLAVSLRPRHVNDTLGRYRTGAPGTVAARPANAAGSPTGSA